MTKTLANGWTEGYAGGIATNKDPDLGGIIDKTFATGEWFVIFNSDHIAAIEGLPSREAAFAAHAATIASTYVL